MELGRFFRYTSTIFSCPTTAEERQNVAILIATMRRYSVAAAEAQSLTGIAETRQLVPTATLMNVEDEDVDVPLIEMPRRQLDVGRYFHLFRAPLMIQDKTSFTIDRKFHWWSLVSVVLIVVQLMISTYIAAFQAYW